MKKESPRLFESSFMEAMSKIHWTVPMFVFIPVILFFLYRSIYIVEVQIKEIILLYFAGALLWTFMEYLIHRFAFHFEAKTDFSKRLVFIFHGIHHDHPNDRLRLVMPPSVSVPLGIIFYSAFHYIIGVDFASPLFAGFATGYLAYDMIHFGSHHFAIKSKFFMKIKTHHMKHHFKDPNRGYGVSSPLWDYIFQTEYKD